MSEEIIIEDLPFSDNAMEFVSDLYTDPFYIDQYPSSAKVFKGVYSMIRAWENGIGYFWVALLDEKPIGVFHGHFLNKFQFEIHFLILKDFQGQHNWPIQEQAFKDTVQVIFEGSPALKFVVGFPPANMDNSVNFFKRSGFKQMTELPDYYDYDGKQVSAEMMILARGDI